MTATLEPSSEAERHILVSKLTKPSFWRDWQHKGDCCAEIQSQWSTHLAKRKRPKPLDQIFGARSTALCWGLGPRDLDDLSHELLKVVQQLQKKPGEAAAGEIQSLADLFLASAASSKIGVGFSLQCLAMASLLANASRSFDNGCWWEVLGKIAEHTDQCDQWHVDGEQPAEEVLTHQLFTGELRLSLAYHFPEIRQFAKGRKAGLETIEEGMLELLDSEGLPKANYLGIYRALLACWTRCQAMACQLKKEAWEKKCAPHFRSAVTQALHLSSPGGTSLLADGEADEWNADFLAALLARGGDAVDRTAALDLLSKKQTQLIAGKSGPTTREPSTESEWASLAVMRTEFTSRAPVLAVDYSRPVVQIEMWQDKRCLFRGPWNTETRLGNATVRPVESWAQTCWFSDEDVDYLELSIQLEQGARLDRQILLAREDLFLFVNDIVIGNGEPITHASYLPLANQFSFAGESETRDGYLAAERPAARVLPLALPEWRIDPRIGELAQRDDHLVLVQERVGMRMACPLFFDLDMSRLGKPCTWRQLTVASSLEIQAPDVAVGYRVQCHKEQWLLYRSLAVPANRTVLGQNSSDEFFLARFFAKTGEVEELLEIEA